MKTQQEWYDWCIEHGASGDLVFDILKDWKGSDGNLLAALGMTTSALKQIRDNSKAESVFQVNNTLNAGRAVAMIQDVAVFADITLGSVKALLETGTRREHSTETA